MNDYLDKIKKVEEELENQAQNKVLERNKAFENLKESLEQQEKETIGQAETIILEAKQKAETEANSQIEKLETQNKKEIEAIKENFSKNLDHALKVIVEEIDR